MFRYNSKGEFNVPYGGIAYNKKNFRKKIDYLKSEPLQELLSKTNIVNSDFQDFFNLYEPTEKDFIFLDPPYDTEFSTYAQNDFVKTDQKRLADFLINTCKAKWMMIIKNTDFIFDLYNHPKIKISTFDKTYLVSFMNRNDKNVEHLLITNY
jgi:DNA adenine methylase